MLKGDRITAFQADKARALLAYLVMEADRPHRRESLAALLWPDYPEANARNNLRQTLYRVRLALVDASAKPPHLLITTRDIQFNPESDYWLDANEFRRRVSEFLHVCSQGQIPSDACLEGLETALDLYRGDFLSGFNIAEAPQFEGWLLSHQEMFHHLNLEVLTLLVEHLTRRRKFTSAIKYAQRAVAQEPWFESSQRKLIRILALSGQGYAALRQYEDYRQSLTRELGVEPSQETRQLVEVIRNGTLREMEDEGQLPAWTTTFLNLTPGNTPFVAREKELTQLHRHLSTTLTGQGHLVFVKGESGSGKTMLMREFARQAMQEHENLLVAVGSCRAIAGNGLSYLPFLEILRMLSGEESCIRLSGLPSELTSRHLRSAFPDVLQVLIESSPDLLRTLAPEGSLLFRALTFPRISHDRLSELCNLLRTPRPSESPKFCTTEGCEGSLEVETSGVNHAEGHRLENFDQIAQSIIALGRRWPLLLILDDMQWIDQDSINLLFHMLWQVSCAPILILGAYRPDEIVRRESGECHSLEQVIREVKRRIGEDEIDLSQADGRHFVDAFLETEPTRLSRTFRQNLYQLTEGHPLFTVELLRGMQQSGELMQNEQGFGVSNPTLEWERLPVRIDAVIAERVSRVSDFSRDILAAASVQGKTFILEVVAKVIGAHESLVANKLTGELGKQYELVSALCVERSGDRYLSMFQFRHHLHQIYLYKSLDEVERTRLMLATDQAIDELHCKLSYETLLEETEDSDIL